MSYKGFDMDLRKMPDKPFTKKHRTSPDCIDKSALQENDAACIDQKQDGHSFWDKAADVRVFAKIDVESDWLFVKKKIGSSYQHHKKATPLAGYFIRIAALVILTSGLSFAFYKLLILPKVDGDGFASINADNQKKSILLPDGSSVLLNIGSGITYGKDFGYDSRNVILKGEAYFSVIPDSSLPFRVFASNSVIEVTGTKFAVNVVNGTIQVSVISGKVLLSAVGKTEKKISITANHSGFLRSDNQLILEKGVPANGLSWKTGHLIFEQTPIDSALMDIAHHFRRELTIDLPLKEKITAEFQDQPLSEILSELSLVAGLEFDTTGIALIVRK